MIGQRPSGNGKSAFPERSRSDVLLSRTLVDDTEDQLNTTRSCKLVVCAMIAAIVPIVANAAGFTQEQADRGKALYGAQCSQCHGTDLEGKEAPALSAETMQNFSTAGGLFDMISVSMPPQAPGELPEDQYLAIMAYILAHNGAQPGEDALVVDYDVLDSIDLVAVTSVAATTNVSEATNADSTVAVPQAYTWGKPLPGSDMFAGSAEGDATGNGVPQAYTWGSELPSVAQ